MREPQTVVVRGRAVELMPLPAMRALRLWPLVAKGLASAVPLEALSQDEVERLARELLSMARVDGRELLPTLDADYCGNIGALIELLVAAVNVNYGSFSGGSDAGQGAAGSG